MSQRWKRPQSRIALLVFMVAFLIYLGVSPSASAAAPQDRIREILDAVSAVLDNPQLRGPDKEAERKQQVRRIIHETFEFEGMAREALGAQWARLTPQQREEFVSLFRDFFEP